MSISFVPGSKVAVPEIQIKDSLTIPSGLTAVIVVDMQNDFVKDGGSLVVPSAAETVPNIAKLLEKARKANVHIAYTQDTQVEDDPEFAIWPRHCVKDTWGWRIIDELAPRPEDLVCPKNRYDGFYGTSLDHFLGRIWHTRHVVIVGTVSNICVLHTAASAGLRWYDVVLPADCTSALTEFDQAATFRQVSSLYAGTVVRSADQLYFE